MKKIVPLLISTTFLFAEYNLELENELLRANNYVKAEEYKLAIAALERALILDPNSDQAKFGLAKIYLKMGNKKRANLYFSQIKNPTPEMQKEINNFFNKLYLNVYLLVGASGDSNVENLTDNDRWKIDNQTYFNNDEKKFAFSVYEYVSIEPIYKDRFEWHNNFSVYNKNVINNSEKDIQVFSYTPYLRDNIKDIQIDYKVNYSYLRYGNNEYANRFSINPQIEFDFLKDHTNITNFILEYNHYLKATNGDDYFLVNFNSKVIKHLYFLDVGVKAEYENSFKKNSSTKTDEYQKYGGEIGFYIPIFNRRLNLETTYFAQNYKDEDKVFHKKEEVKEFSGSIELLKKGRFLDYATKVEYINHHSNIEPYSYNKYIISINFIKQFKGL
jgi:tetratricopeptide (TPR) repeat protein